MLTAAANIFDSSLLDAIIEESQSNGIAYTVDQLRRRMDIVASAGVTDRDELRRHVLSEAGA